MEKSQKERDEGELESTLQEEEVPTRLSSYQRFCMHCI